MCISHDKFLIKNSYECKGKVNDLNEQNYF